MPSSRMAWTECGVGGWPFIAPSPADSTRNSPRPFVARRKSAFGHRAAADVAGADKQNGFHSARQFKVSGERRIVNAEIKAGIHARWPVP